MKTTIATTSIFQRSQDELSRQQDFPKILQGRRDTLYHYSIRSYLGAILNEVQSR